MAEVKHISVRLFQSVSVLKGLYGRKEVQLIFASTLMGVMGVSLISPVFPGVMEHFGVTGGEIGLVVTAYTVPGIVVTPFIGVFADRVGRKHLLIPLLLLFGVAGVGCSLSPDFETLLVLRALQGAGGAGLVTLAITLIGDYFDGAERGRVMGWNGAVLSVGTASYPFIGGVLGTVGWYAPFLLYASAVPIGLLSLPFLPEPEIRKTVDVGSYVAKVRRIASRPETLLASFTAFLAFVLLYGGVVTYLPVLLSERFHQASLVIGLVMGSMSVVTALVSSQAGKLAERYSYRSLFTGGFLGYGTALLAIPFLPSVPFFLVPMVVFGVGHGLVMPNLQTFMTHLAPGEMRAATMSLYNIGLRTGQTVGPAALGLVYLSGIDAVFLYSGAIGVLGFFSLLVAGSGLRS